jgi:hypothetical protein
MEPPFGAFGCFWVILVAFGAFGAFYDHLSVTPASKRICNDGLIWGYMALCSS